MEKLTTQSPTPPTHSPDWFTEKHATAWDRVKEAFQRDWTQTRADFSIAGGRSLNQNVGDTVDQALGSAPIPPQDVKTRPTDPQEIARDVNKARGDMMEAAKESDEGITDAKAAIAEGQVKLDKKVTGIRKDVAKAHAKGDEKIAEAKRAASADIHEQREKMSEIGAKRDEAEGKWLQAEREARYGYAVRVQRPGEEWNDALVTSLRTEWTTLGTGASWEDARKGVRSGWDYANKKH